ncbi:MAG: RluA family pseudouridine synthase [Defluviitaleaceae bacterium]|nr:RluA family pseudouridine synthase [Defluviitaleaceae bacterium]
MSDDLVLYAEEEDAGIRLDVFISGQKDDLSRSFLKKHIESGNVTIGGKPQKAGYKLKAGDVVQIAPYPPVTPDIMPEDITLDICHEDDDIIVINKPKGMVVHPAAGHYAATLVNALLYHCKGNLSGINGILRPGIVHRIDMDTSGLIVAAKNDKAHCSLSEQFSSRKVKKVYEALVMGLVKEESFTIDKPIGRSERDRKKMCVTIKNSKEAITNVKVIERFKSTTFIEARLITGRTHQIRVHMAYLGHPLVGDLVYGPEKSKYKLGGQALFAKSLGFFHPSTGEFMEFEAKRPEYFEDLLRR